MANLIIARDLQSKQFATISDDWLTRFPGEFEKVRDVLDPITQEELEAQDADVAAAAKEREAEIAAAAKAAEAAAAAAAKQPADTGDDSTGFGSRTR